MILRETYRGRAIYYHPPERRSAFGGGYGGDHAELGLASTIGEARARIDAQLAEQQAKDDAARSDADRYWDSLPAEDRARMRRAYTGDAWNRYDSVADFAFAMRP